MNLSDNFFSAFGLPVSYEVDGVDLTRRYRELQKQMHPDKYINSSGSERTMSVQKAAMINDAYNILKNPLLRARYILELNNVLLNDDTNTVMDAEFLMQQMELRESLDAIRSTTDPLKKLDSLVDDVDAQMSVLQKELSSHFAQSKVDFEIITKIIRKLQFFTRLREEMENMYERYEQ